MTPETLARIYAEASAIKNAAEAEDRDLSRPEVEQINQLCSLFDVAETALAATPGRRQTAPDQPGRHEPVDGQFTEPRLFGGPARPETFKLADGSEVRAYAPAERLSHGQPRVEFHMGRFMAAVASGNWRFAQPEYRVMAQQSGLVGSAGQYMVPEPISREVIDLARAASRAISAGVRTIPMDSATLSFARVANDPTPRWREENVAIPNSQITFEEVVLRARTVGAIVVSSNELLQDAPNCDQLLRHLLAESLAGEIDRIVFQGEAGSPGTEPTGIINNPLITKMVFTQKVTHYGPIMDALRLLWTRNASPDVLVHSVGSAYAFGNLRDSTGQPMQQPPDVAGLRKLTSNRIANVGGSPDAYRAILGGLNEVALGVRLPLELAIATAGDTDAAGDDVFSKFQTRFRMVARCDVAVLRPNQLLVLDNIEP